MIRDAKTQFFDSQAVTDTELTSDALQFEVDDLGEGEPKGFFFHVDTEFNDTGSTGTLTFAIEASGDNSSWHEVLSSRAYDADDLVGGMGFNGYLPKQIGGKYIRAKLTPAGSAFDAGAVSAGLRY